MHSVWNLVIQSLSNNLFIVQTIKIVSLPTTAQILINRLRMPALIAIIAVLRMLWAFLIILLFIRRKQNGT